MKLIVSLEEAKTIILSELKRRGLQVKEDTITQVSHFEGQYDEQTTILDGFSVELK